mmetsp:Transcript_58935/g.140396  ORF Transcript_58935/g.140396 Transcript_58935/m.140396 type:complete len:201 (+) Transcript_58935:552-1154(+)
MLAAASRARFILAFQIFSKLGNFLSTSPGCHGGGVGWSKGCSGSFSVWKVVSSTPYATGCSSWLTLPSKYLSTHSGSTCMSLLYAFICIMSAPSMPDIMSPPRLLMPRASTSPVKASILASLIMSSCWFCGYFRRSGKPAGRGNLGSRVAGSSSANLSSKRGVAFSRPRGLKALGKPFCVERRKECSANHCSCFQSMKTF